ncbi:MAG: hypothetical protein QG657_3151 [Acidobacteriota bacterium]|nr:hypothetical protein [Acidobacteriota bacterium]
MSTLIDTFTAKEGEITIDGGEKPLTYNGDTTSIDLSSAKTITVTKNDGVIWPKIEATVDAKSTGNVNIVEEINCKVDHQEKSVKWTITPDPTNTKYFCVKISANTTETKTTGQNKSRIGDPAKMRRRMPLIVGLVTLAGGLVTLGGSATIGGAVTIGVGVILLLFWFLEIHIYADPQVTVTIGEP